MSAKSVRISASDNLESNSLFSACKGWEVFNCLGPILFLFPPTGKKSTEKAAVLRSFEEIKSKGEARPRRREGSEQVRVYMGLFKVDTVSPLKFSLIFAGEEAKEVCKPTGQFLCSIFI